MVINVIRRVILLKKIFRGVRGQNNIQISQLLLNVSISLLPAGAR